MYEPIKLHTYERNWVEMIWFERDEKWDLFIPSEKVVKLLDPKMSLEQVHIELCKIVILMNFKVSHCLLH